MVSESRPVIVIPAFNEAKNILHTIQLIYSVGIPVHIIVVNDGSKDNTAKLAAAAGVEVISFRQNKGKAAAVFAGMRRAIRLRTESIIMIDADMTQITHYGLGELIRRSTIFTRKGTAKMVVAGIKENWDDDFELFSSSGIRSFSIPGVFELLRYRDLKKVKGYGLEAFLTNFFGKSGAEYVHGLGFEAQPAYRKGMERQLAQELREKGRSQGLSEKRKATSPPKPKQRRRRRP